VNGSDLENLPLHAPPLRSSRSSPGDEERLSGGNVSEVVRVGDTVRRRTGPWSPAVHALLRHLEAVGFDGAPRFLGIDGRGREILTFVDGEVPTGPDPSLVTDTAIQSVGVLIRSMHEAVADFALPSGPVWHHRPLAGPPPHVVCHHDLAPRNTVFRDGRAVAFIDWDMATPEAPIHDLVHAAWQFVPLISDDACREYGWTELPSRGDRLRLLLDAYGLSTVERAGFAERVAERMESSAGGIHWLAALGEAPFRALVERGVPEQILRDRDWICSNAAMLNRAISRGRPASRLRRSP
jgi:hypothetical protein